jgi:hypothetical protein
MLMKSQNPFGRRLEMRQNGDKTVSFAKEMIPQHGIEEGGTSSAVESFPQLPSGFLVGVSGSNGINAAQFS